MCLSDTCGCLRLFSGSLMLCLEIVRSAQECLCILISVYICMIERTGASKLYVFYS